jgi:hypothetical protein
MHKKPTEQKDISKKRKDYDKVIYQQLAAQLYHSVQVQLFVALRRLQSSVITLRRLPKAAFIIQPLLGSPGLARMILRGHDDNPPEPPKACPGGFNATQSNPQKEDAQCGKERDQKT